MDHGLESVAVNGIIDFAIPKAGQEDYVRTKSREILLDRIRIIEQYYQEKMCEKEELDSQN